MVIVARNRLLGVYFTTEALHAALLHPAANLGNQSTCTKGCLSQLPGCN